MPAIQEKSVQNSTRPDHNIPNGPVKTCQVCGSGNLELVIDLGHQPLCDTLLSKDQLQEPETTYPLRQLWCKDCTLSQLDYVVPGEVVYHPGYPYRTGITKELAMYQDQMAADIIQDLGVAQNNLIVDIGSNDGTLLKGFKKRDMRPLGVEPTNIAQIANEDGIETIQAPFNENVAEQILKSHGPAKVVTATNVFAHMQSLGDVLRGLEILVADDGYFVLENHYLTAIMEHLQFDTIYHEHLRSYSLKSLVTLFDFYDFTVIDAMTVSRYGGNIRVYVAKGKNHIIKPSVQALLDAEDKTGFSDPAYYKKFQDKATKVKNDLLGLILDCKEKGHSIVGNSCPARASTLLNFAGIGPDLIPYIAEQPTSLKLNQYLPGMHIPIVNNQRLIDEQPDYVILLAWHYWEPISQQLRERGLKSKMIVPLPEVRIIED